MHFPLQSHLHMCSFVSCDMCDLSGKRVYAQGRRKGELILRTVSLAIRLLVSAMVNERVSHCLPVIL